MLMFSKRSFLALTLLIQLLAFSIFLLGFFPLKQSLKGSGEIRNHTLETHVISHPKKQYDRIVIVLIDALRSDFVFEKAKMPFIREQLKQGHANGYVVKAHPPTVTLPRIKALTSGTIPGFVDVVLNFDSKSLAEDNLVTQAYTAGRKIIFYGDDTWIKLFPDHFTRSEGTTSFFVTDYTEVDDNVTRHIDTELTGLDWDLMILHYLGLDHIGHTVGPTSPLVKPKLQEMDTVIQRIFTSLEEREEKFLILVCGDHGMSDQGSHGGASNREILVPAVFLNPSYKMQGREWKSRRDVLQIDLAPTLSMLMGLPVPNNNLGQVLVGALQGLSDEEILGALYINMEQIVRLMEKSVPDFQRESSYDLYQHALDLHKIYLDNKTEHAKPDILWIVRSYASAMEAMSSKISGSLTTYDLYAMLLAILLLTLTLVSAVLGSMHDAQSLYLSISPPIVIAASLLVIFGHMTSCTSQSFYSTTLCGRSFTSVAMQLSVFASIMFLATATLSFSHRLGKRNVRWFPKSSYTRLLLMGTILHTLSFGSSSFVEEEHQTWYFFVVTFNIVAMVMHIKGHVTLLSLRKPQTRGMKNSRTNVYFELSQNELRNGEVLAQYTTQNKNELIESRCRQLYNSHMNKDFRDSEHFYKTLHSPSEKVLLDVRMLPWKQICGIFIVMLLGRFLRTINQTGNKWLDTPDLADWLMIPEKKPVLSVVVFVSHLVIISATGLKLCVESIIFVTGIYTCYQYRVTTGAVNSVFDFGSSSDVMSKGISEARVVFLLILLMNLISLIKWCCLSKGRLSLLSEQERNKSYLPLKCVQTLHLSWILLMTLLLRTHNTLLVAMVIVQELLLWRCVIKNIGLPSNFLAIFCWWMGQAVFFQQGNSNSISTVDVSAGYVGLQDYKPVLVGMLLFCSTYAGPIYWLITLVKYILLSRWNTECMKKKSEESPVTENNKAAKANQNQTVKTELLDCVHALSLERLVTLLLYSLIVTSQRYHLFVWTVFSPKLLYEGMLTVTMALFSFIILALV